MFTHLDAPSPGIIGLELRATGNARHATRFMARSSLTSASDLQECIDECRRAARVCRETFDACYHMTGLRQEPVLMSILAACGELLERGVALMQENVHVDEWLLRTCAELARECASECENARVETTLLIACARACDRAAGRCEQLAVNLSGPRWAHASMQVSNVLVRD